MNAIPLLRRGNIFIVVLGFVLTPLSVLVADSQQSILYDTAYVRRVYYDCTFSNASEMSGSGGVLSGHTTLPIKSTAAESVWLEDTTGLNPGALNYSVAIPTAPVTTTVAIRMYPLVSGVDYSLDRTRGILTFFTPVPVNAQVAIDFTLNDGTRLSSLVAGGVGVLLEDRFPEAPGRSQQIKRFYRTPSHPLVRDNGLGNFTLKVMDKNAVTEIGSSLSPIQKYPDSIAMNFDLGVVELSNPLPFPDVYLPTANNASPLHAVIFVDAQLPQASFVPDSLLLEKNAWRVAANPISPTFNAVADFQGREAVSSHVRWTDIDAQTTDPTDGSATQKALSVAYNLNTNTLAVAEQVSLVNVLSTQGADLSEKSTFYFELEGAGSAGANVDLLVEFGSFNEDSDNDAQLDTEDAGLRDGLLSPGEDIGWTFNGSGNDLATGTADDTSAAVGSSNGILDNEDFDNDRALRTVDLPATVHPIFEFSHGYVDTNGSLVSDLGFVGRKAFQIPLNIVSLSAEERNRLRAVREVRVTLRNRSGLARSGTVVITRMAILGAPAASQNNGGGVGHPLVFPNPLRPAKGHSSMTFTNLPAATRIRLYTLSGEMVNELTCDSSGTVLWSGDNYAGEKVASGVYVVLLDGAGEKKTIKVAVQR